MNGATTVLATVLMLTMSTGKPVSNSRALLVTSADIHHVNVGYIHVPKGPANLLRIPFLLGYLGSERSNVEGGKADGGEAFFRFKVTGTKLADLALNAKTTGDTTEFSMNRAEFLSELQQLGISLPPSLKGSILNSEKITFSLSTDEQLKGTQAVKEVKFFLTDGDANTPPKHSLSIEIGTEEVIQEKLKEYSAGLVVSAAAGKKLFDSKFSATPLIFHIERELIDEEDRQVPEPVKKGWYFVRHSENTHPGGYLVLPSLNFSNTKSERPEMVVSEIHENKDESVHFVMNALPVIQSIVLPAILGKTKEKSPEDYELECFIPGSQQAQLELACKRVEENGNITYRLEGDVSTGGTVEFVLKNKKKAADRYIVTISKNANAPLQDGEPSIQALR